MTAILPNTRPIYLAYGFSINRLLNVCKRLKENLSNRLIDEYKRLMKDIGVDNQSFMKFARIAPIRELRI